MEGGLTIHRLSFYTNCRGEFTPRINSRQQFTAEYAEEDARENWTTRWLMKVNFNSSSDFLRVLCVLGGERLFPGIDVYAEGMRFTHL